MLLVNLRLLVYPQRGSIALGKLASRVHPRDNDPHVDLVAVCAALLL